jgi:hypothetical protein
MVEAFSIYLLCRSLNILLEDIVTFMMLPLYDVLMLPFCDAALLTLLILHAELQKMNVFKQ